MNTTTDVHLHADRGDTVTAHTDSRGAFLRLETSPGTGAHSALVLHLDGLEAARQLAAASAEALAHYAAADGRPIAKAAS